MGRRYTDRKWPRHARDLWLLVITLIVLLALNSALDAVNRVQEGRKVGTQISCAVLSAVSEAGEKVIANPGGLPPRLERFLVRHGYPSRGQRERAARAHAKLYVRAISRRVHQLVGQHGDGLIRRDGTINCQRLERLGETRGT